MAERLHGRQPVQYVGPQDGEDEVWQGHPGRVLDDVGSFVVVAWVNGPSTEVAVDDIATLTEQEYVARGERVASLLHPLRDTPIPRVNVAGHEWP